MVFDSLNIIGEERFEKELKKREAFKNEIDMINKEIDKIFLEVGREYINKTSRNEKVENEENLEKVQDALKIKERLIKELSICNEEIKYIKLIKSQKINIIEEEHVMEKLDKMITVGAIEELEYKERVIKYEERVKQFRALIKIAKRYEDGEIDAKNRDININKVIKS